jgi:hypothetical protein
MKLDYEQYRQNVLDHAQQHLYSHAPHHAGVLMKIAREVPLIEMWKLFYKETDYYSFKALGTMLAKHALGEKVMLVSFVASSEYFAYVRPSEDTPGPKAIANRQPGDRAVWHYFEEKYPVMVIGPAFCEVS